MSSLKKSVRKGKRRFSEKRVRLGGGVSTVIVGTGISEWHDGKGIHLTKEAFCIRTLNYNCLGNR